MPDRRCTLPDCSRKHIAKGMCAYHYNLKNYPGPKKYKLVDMPCAHCGVVMRKQKRSDRARQFCSYVCRDAVSFAPAREREARRLSGVMVHVGRRPTPQEVRPPKRVWISATCEWCGGAFLVADQVSAKFCSRSHAWAAKDARRGAKRSSIPLKVRMAVYVRDNWNCQLCAKPVDPALTGTNDVWSPTLDHIECQSWALIPDHSPSNLRLAHRWCNSVRGDERYHTAEVLTA